MIGHIKASFMSPQQFEQVVQSVREYVYLPGEAYKQRRRIVSLMGGEPLLSPHFPELVDILNHYIPEKWKHGLLTALDWPHYKHPKYGPAVEHVLRLLGPHPNGSVRSDDHNSCGFLNFNSHGDIFPPNHLGIRPCDEGKEVKHQPMLTAVDEAVDDAAEMWQLIEGCWLQSEWSSSFRESGFYFCEVAGTISDAFKLDVGLPITPDAWKHDLVFETEKGVRLPKGAYADQIHACCPRCGICVPNLPGRLDKEEVDDISPANLVELREAGSPRIRKGHFVEWSEVDIAAARSQGDNWQPHRYCKEK